MPMPVIPPFITKEFSTYGNWQPHSSGKLAEIIINATQTVRPSFSE